MRNMTTRNMATRNMTTRNMTRLGEGNAGIVYSGSDSIVKKKFKRKNKKKCIKAFDNHKLVYNIYSSGKEYSYISIPKPFECNKSEYTMERIYCDRLPNVISEQMGTRCNLNSTIVYTETTEYASEILVNILDVFDENKSHAITKELGHLFGCLHLNGIIPWDCELIYGKTLNNPNKMLYLIDFDKIIIKENLTDKEIKSSLTDSIVPHPKSILYDSFIIGLKTFENV